MFRILEQKNIKFISKEATLRLEKLLEDYQKDNNIIHEYNLKPHEIPKRGYKKYQIILIKAMNKGDSELIVGIKHKTILYYEKETLEYEVSQIFTRFLGVQFIYTKQDIRDGIWSMSWKLLK